MKEHLSIHLQDLSKERVIEKVNDQMPPPEHVTLSLSPCPPEA